MLFDYIFGYNKQYYEHIDRQIEEEKKKTRKGE